LVPKLNGLQALSLLSQSIGAKPRRPKRFLKA
jgi:hypothetical protein